MKPTDELVKEHSAIQSMLAILSAACARLENGDRANIADLKKMLDFLKVFVDGCHHAKEEEFLFPSLERAGISRRHGPIAIMLAEHSLGRSHIDRMTTSLIALANGDLEAGKEFAQHARAYIHLLTMHIEKENQVLFTMADVVLSPEDQTALMKDFEKLEVERIGSGKHEQFHQTLHELKEVYVTNPVPDLPVRAAH